MDDGQGLGQGQDVSSSPDANTTQAFTPAVTESAPSERVFRQSEVNELVGRVKREERAKYTQNDDSHQQRAYEAQPRSQMAEQDIRRVAAEEAQRLRDEWYKEAQANTESQYAQKIVENFWNKLAPGKEKYQDFDQITGDIEFSRFPNVVQLLAENVDNAHDVLYELGKDRLKMVQLEQLSQMSPKDAISHAKRLADSIKQNEEASRVRHPNQPLSQLKPSNVSTDSGVMSVSDYRRRYKI